MLRSHQTAKPMPSWKGRAEIGGWAGFHPEPKTAWVRERRGEKEHGGEPGGRKNRRITERYPARAGEAEQEGYPEQTACSSFPSRQSTGAGAPHDHHPEHPGTDWGGGRGGGEDSFLEGKIKGFTASARAPWTRDISQKDSLQLYLSNKNTVT